MALTIEELEALLSKAITRLDKLEQSDPEETVTIKALRKEIKELRDKITEKAIDPPAEVDDAGFGFFS